MNYTLCLLETITQSEQKVIGMSGIAVVVVVVVVAVVVAVVVVVVVVAEVFCVTIRRKTIFDTK